MILALAFLFIPISNSWARRDEATNTSAEVELDLHVNIPSIVSIQIGSSGMVIDEITFLATETASKVPIVKSNTRPPFIITSNTSQGTTLVVDSSSGLRSGDKTIPFSAICWKGTGALAGSEGCFDGTANQRLRSFSGRGSWRGSYIFEYHRSYKHAPGDYTGRITYTLTTP